MKRLQKIALPFALFVLLASCQSGTDVNQTLSKTETRMEMMNKIAEDSTMSKEMMGAMLNSQNGKMLMMEHQTMMMGDNSSMMQMMKDNPEMMQSMMSGMMETAKGDTAMMWGMCKRMMENPQMMDMMQKRMGEMDNKMKH